MASAIFGNCFADWHVENGVATHPKTGRVYGHVLKESPNLIRAKLLGMFFYQIPLAAVAIPWKIVSLCLGDFVASANAETQRVNNLAFQKWSQNQSPSTTPPSLDEGKTKRILIQLVKDIAKIVLIPFATLAKSFICLYGLVDPYGGRALYGEIGEALSSHGMLEDVQCMQPMDIWDRHNLYRSLNDKKHSPALKESYAIRLKIVQMREIYENEGLNVDDLVGKTLKLIKYLKNLQFKDLYPNLCLIKEHLDSIPNCRSTIINKLIEHVDASYDIQRLQNHKVSVVNGIEDLIAHIEKELSSKSA